MDFTFSEEQRMMAGALRALLDDICAGSDLRALFERRDSAQEERWRRLSDMGLCGVLAPAGSGGLGLGDTDFVLLAEETGRAALPEPLSEQAGVAVPLLAELASDARAARLLASAASGTARIAVAHPHNPYINVPPGVTHYLLCTPETITLIDAAQARTVPEVSIDAARQLVRMQAVEGEALLIGSGIAASGCVARAANRGAVYTAAQCLGLAERMITLAVEYAKQRVQFGKPIGSYQAIKHHLASAQVKLEFARPVVYAAVTRVADTDARALAAASHAKLAAVDAAELAARTAIQVHGAMGYSWEVDLQFYMKRAWALAGVWGTRSFHACRVQSLICGGELALGPDATFERRA